MFLGAFISLSFGIAMAAEGAATGSLDSGVKQMAALAAGLGIAIAAFGGAISRTWRCFRSRQYCKKSWRIGPDCDTHDHQSGYDRVSRYILSCCFASFDL